MPSNQDLSFAEAARAGAICGSFFLQGPSGPIQHLPARARQRRLVSVGLRSMREAQKELNRAMVAEPCSRLRSSWIARWPRSPRAQRPRAIGAVLASDWRARVLSALTLLRVAIMHAWIRAIIVAADYPENAGCTIRC